MQIHLLLADGNSVQLQAPASSCQWVNLNAPALAEAVRIEVPIIDIQGYWHPLLFRPRMQLEWDIRFTAAANQGFPFLSFFNSRHQNRCTMGMSDLSQDVEVRARLDQTRHAYQVEFRLKDWRNVKLKVDTREHLWAESLSDFRKDLTGESVRNYPDSSWLPVYCTWYARHRNFNSEWIEATAPIASELGFGTLIVDDGWSCADRSTITPETIVNWFATTGEWEPDPAKFSDFTSHVERVKQIGLRYMLWIAPLMLGVESEPGKRAYQNQPVNAGFFDAHPADEKQVHAILQTVEDLLRSAPIDGLKVDFLDDLKPSLAAQVGRPMRQFMQRLSDQIHSVHPHAMIEYRQRYTGIGSLGLATNFRCNDAPYDFTENLHRLAMLRMVLGDGVPVHADPAYWHPLASEQEISRHLIASLAGVPMLSMDLVTIPSHTRRLIQHWLGVYRRHIETFKHGHWNIRWHFDHVTAVEVSTNHESVTLVYDQMDWPLPAICHTEKQCIINGSDYSLPLQKPMHVINTHGQVDIKEVLAPGELAES